MENGSILIVMIIAAFIGRRSIFIGCLAGALASIAFFFIFERYTLKAFAMAIIYGTLTSLVASVLAHIIFPGFKGGGHNSGPTFIGGGDRLSGIHSGIVPTDEELKARKENEREIP